MVSVGTGAPLTLGDGPVARALAGDAADETSRQAQRESARQRTVADRRAAA
jgi:hypothetical protein